MVEVSNGNGIKKRIVDHCFNFNTEYMSTKSICQFPTVNFITFYFNMDPWSITVCHQETVILTSTSDLSHSNCRLAFEDNFKPSVAFEKLPDSDEYLAVLGNYIVSY